jgi:hypothetical protein
MFKGVVLIFTETFFLKLVFEKFHPLHKWIPFVGVIHSINKKIFQDVGFGRIFQ